MWSAVHMFTTLGIYGVFAVSFDLDGAILLANVLVSNCLDDCYSLSSGIADTDFAKLQQILNRLALVVINSPPFTRNVPLWRSIHWQAGRSVQGLFAGSP